MKKLLSLIALMLIVGMSGCSKESKEESHHHNCCCCCGGVSGGSGHGTNAPLASTFTKPSTTIASALTGGGLPAIGTIPANPITINIDPNINGSGGTSFPVLIAFNLNSQVSPNGHFTATITSVNGGLPPSRNSLNAGMLSGTFIGVQTSVIPSQPAPPPHPNYTIVVAYSDLAVAVSSVSGPPKDPTPTAPSGQYNITTFTAANGDAATLMIADNWIFQ